MQGHPAAQLQIPNLFALVVFGQVVHALVGEQVAQDDLPGRSVKVQFGIAALVVGQPQVIVLYLSGKAEIAPVNFTPKMADVQVLGVHLHFGVEIVEGVGVVLELSVEIFYHKLAARDRAGGQQVVHRRFEAKCRPKIGEHLAAEAGQGAVVGQQLGKIYPAGPRAQVHVDRLVLGVKNGG